MYTGNLISALMHTAKSLDMRELSPDAPRYTTAEDRCRVRSLVRPDHRCILRADHGKQGFVSCQFSSEDKDCEEGCAAGIGIDATGENGYDCAKPVVPGTNYCAAHQPEDTRVEDLIYAVDRNMKRSGDLYLDLAEVKTILADRRPMTTFDEMLWWEADRLQEEVLSGPEEANFFVMQRR